MADFGVHYCVSLVDRLYGQKAVLGKGILEDWGHFLSIFMYLPKLSKTSMYDFRNQ